MAVDNSGLAALIFLDMWDENTSQLGARWMGESAATGLLLLLSMRWGVIEVR